MTTQIPQYQADILGAGYEQLTLNFPDDYDGRMEYMIVMLLYQTGMRVSELVNLKDTQIDFSRSQIKVLGKAIEDGI